jgi:serine/threonine protein kinase
MLIKGTKSSLFYVMMPSAHILHRDISPNNIMLVRDDDGRVCNVLLIDFDLASILETNNNPANIGNHFRTVGS